jgi:hypothetical protein
MRNLIFLFVLIFASACGEKGDRLETALRLAGDRRGELQKVLNHYADNPQKLQAAVFLIENMPGHRSYVSDELSAIGFKQRYEDIFFDRGLMPDQKKEELENLSSRYNLEANIAEDVEIITADYLIDNIERSFEIWKNVPYCQHLNFDEFCELILPYKCAELQELDNWKEVMGRIYDRLSVMEHNDETYSNPQNAAKILTEYFGAHKKNYTLDYSGYTLYNESTLPGARFGTCADFSMAAVALMRSKGIPACFESIPLWGRGSVGHSWHTILNDNGMYMPSPWNWESFPGDVFFPKEEIPKIFRQTYAANPFYEEYCEKSLLKLPLFHKFQNDVTDVYIKTSDLEIPVRTKNIKEKYAYLAAFDNRNWTPVDLGMIKWRKARFNNVGQRIAYIVMGYDGEKLVPISEPFILDHYGNINYCTPHPEVLDSVKLTRKFPKKEKTAIAENYVKGGQIQGANKFDFTDADVLYKIENSEYPDLIPLDTTKRYRYWRFYQGSRVLPCALAELQFFVSDSIGKPARGKIICHPEEMERQTELENLFDNDWLSSYTSNLNGGWVGIDFGQPVSMESVRIVPRSDDNGIHYDDNYELKYWDGGWVSLGEQIAKERYLLFDGVPKGALLLLSDNTRGKEERLFTLEDGRVRWW